MEKFAISKHSWDEPFERMVDAAKGKPYRRFTPKIGETLSLADLPQSLPKWWESVD